MPKKNKYKGNPIIDVEIDEQIADVEEQELTPDEKDGFDLSLLCESADDPTTNPSINYPQLVNNFAQHYSMDDLNPPDPILDEEAEINQLKEEE